MRFIIGICLCFSIVFAYKDLGTVGKTYEIKEKDMIESFREEYEKLDKKKLMLDILKSVEKNLHADLGLPFCSENKTKTYNLIKPLENDIIIPEGDIFIPKGTIDESLKYQEASYIAANLNDDLDFNFYSKNRHPLLITSGDVRDKRIKKVIEKYILTKEIADVFHITCTPSILEFKQGILTIKEFHLTREEGKK